MKIKRMSNGELKKEIMIGVAGFWLSFILMALVLGLGALGNIYSFIWGLFISIWFFLACVFHTVTIGYNKIILEIRRSGGG